MERCKTSLQEEKDISEFFKFILAARCNHFYEDFVGPVCRVSYMEKRALLESQPFRSLEENSGGRKQFY